MRFFSYLILTLALIVLPKVEATSLYNAKTFRALTADKRALRIGDTVTIIVLETAQASASAGSADKSEFGFGAQAGVNEKNWQYGVGVNGNTKGTASTQRKGQLRAQITAVVIQVDENKNLIIQGKQTLTIDGEVQVIELSGRARRSDIASNNTLLSSRLFDAKISFVGNGDVTEGKEEGVFARIFKWLGLK